MKHVRKFASLLLVMVMAFALAAPAWATSGGEPTDPTPGTGVTEPTPTTPSETPKRVDAPADATYTITIQDAKVGHVYQVYQIFTGKLSYEDGSQGAETGKVLSDIQWGSGVTEAGKTTLGDAATKAEDVKEAGAQAFAEELVKGNHLGTPVEKTVSANGDFDITDLAPGYYLIIDKDGAVSGTDVSYSNYIVQVLGNVQMKPKTTVPEVSKKVKDIDDSTGETSNWQDSADYDIGDDVPFQLTATIHKKDQVDSYEAYAITFTDTLSKGLTYKQIDSVKVKVGEGTATDIPENMFEVTATPGQDETTLTIAFDNIKGLVTADNTQIIIEYTATLNGNAVIGSTGNPNEVELTYSNNPNSDSKGTTQKDTVTVFTFQAIVNKIDGDKKPLEGAGFTLYKEIAPENDGEDPTWKEVGVAGAGAGVTTFEFVGLDAGKYRIEESTVPAGYNKIDDIYFTVAATHEETSDNPQLTELKVTKITDAEGQDLMVKRDPDNPEKILSGKFEFTGNPDSGSVSTDIVNNSGVELPETGGMGTKIFYMVGGALVVGAAVLLVTKKRMSDR